MAGFSELAVATIQSSQQRIDVIAENVANIATPGYRTKRVFQHVLSDRVAIPQSDFVANSRAMMPVMRVTSQPLDLAIAGDAWLLLREGDRFVPVSSVQLRLDAEKRLVDNKGRVLQAAGGGDLVISASDPQILFDGVVLVNGQPEGRIGLFAVEPEDIASGALDHGFAPVASDEAMVRQGMIVPSDVELSAEMVSLSQASRMAETGARLFKMYDELLNSAASKLGDLKA